MNIFSKSSNNKLQAEGAGVNIKRELRLQVDYRYGSEARLSNYPIVLGQ